MPFVPFQSFQIGGDGGSRFRGGGIMLEQELFEIHSTGRCGHALRRFVASHAIRCVKCLAPLQGFLRPRRACDTQCQRTNRQPGATTYHRQSFFYEVALCI